MGQVILDISISAEGFIAGQERPLERPRYERKRLDP
jgi:hypothetical protein